MIITHVVIVCNTRYERDIPFDHADSYESMRSLSKRLQWTRRQLEDWAERIIFIGGNNAS